MINLKAVTLNFNSQSEPKSKQPSARPDCYLIIEVSNQLFYTKTVQPHQNIYQWKLNPEELKISLNPKGELLQIKLIDYDQCKERNSFQMELQEDFITDSNKKMEQTFQRNTEEQVTITLQFDGLGSTIIKSEQNIGFVSRNSKKTKTTNYEDSFMTPNLSKVSSLKQMINCSKQPSSSSPAGTPNLRQLAYLRSYRQNLEKKLYTSIELQARTMKRYIV